MPIKPENKARYPQNWPDVRGRILVYHHGMVPTETPPGTIDLVLLAKGGTARQLRINRTGTVLAAEQAAAV